MVFKLANSSASPPSSPLPTDFTVSAPPGTDLWRKPPTTHASNAPILYQAITLATFRKARVAVSADWKTLYDQGGLVLVQNPSAPASSKWVKSGIEFYNGRANVSTVAADRWADWSLLPLAADGARSVTIEMEREVRKNGELGPALWVYVIEGVERKAIREVSWFFEDADADASSDDAEAWVGVYAAKPTAEAAPGREKDSLEVSFSHLVIETATTSS